LIKTRLPAVVEDTLKVGTSSILTHTLNKLLPLRHDDGTDLLQNVIVRPVNSGKSVNCLLQVSDVTAPVTRERVLRDRQNARYHAIVDSAREAIITTDSNRTIHWVNTAVGDAFGYTSADLLGQKIEILLDKTETLQDEWFQKGSDKKPMVIQVAGRKKSGELVFFSVSFGQWQADDRLFTTTIWRDVTERMAAEAALRESEGRQRALLEALPQLVWTCANNGDCDFVNPQWGHYTGTFPEQCFGFAWLNVVNPEDRPDFEAAWRLSLASGSVLNADARLARVDGAYRWFKMRSIPVRHPSGDIIRWFGTATDITDLIEARDTLRRSNDELEAAVTKRTQEREVAIRQLHESQKMESIGQLTGGVAHDFNNLLAVILSSLSLLKKNLPKDPRTSRLIEGAIQGAERGTSLTKRLLAFARRQELKIEAIDIHVLIPDLLDFLRQSLGPMNSIAVDISSDVHPVKIDANQFELALMNLAVNARDAMPNGGVLTIRAQDASASEQGSLPKELPRGEYVKISVTDTGVGMDEATLTRAMEPFFTTKGVGRGTGLGLSMVHGLVAQSGGTVNIASEPGKGTTVNLWLPRASREEVKEVHEAPVQPRIEDRKPGARVLLVDDDSLVSMNTANMLMDLGYSVLETASGLQALRVLEEDSQFDAVVTDYAMPGMTGLDLAKKIKQLWPKIPVVIASGYAELPSDASLSSTADALLSSPRLNKPYTQQQISDVLDAVTSQRHCVKSQMA
jgi:PAS domain S-box-containing protein